MPNSRKELITARKAAKLTQANVAAQAGLSRGHYANIELGRFAPSLNVARAIASVLGVSVDSIFLPMVHEKRTKPEGYHNHSDLRKETEK